MKRFLSSLPAVGCLLVIARLTRPRRPLPLPSRRHRTKPPAAATESPEKAAPTEKPAPKKSKQAREREKKAKAAKAAKPSTGFDPKSFLLKLVLMADEDGDGALSAEEFRKVPLLKELKTERVDSLFAEIDADTNASLNSEEIGKGFGKITNLAKENRALLDDADASKQTKKLKQLAK